MKDQNVRVMQISSRPYLKEVLQHLHTFKMFSNRLAGNSNSVISIKVDHHMYHILLNEAQYDTSIEWNFRESTIKVFGILITQGDE